MKLQIPVIRRGFFPELITNEILGVQSMGNSAGLAFALHYMKNGEVQIPLYKPGADNSKLIWDGFFIDSAHGRSVYLSFRIEGDLHYRRANLNTRGHVWALYEDDAPRYVQWLGFVKGLRRGDMTNARDLEPNTWGTAYRKLIYRGLLNAIEAGDAVDKIEKNFMDEEFGRSI